MIGAHINSSIVKSSKFIGCNNCLTNFNKSDFYDVTFQDCDFSRLLIKDCKFYDCIFINCKTTNKIFESCIFINSRFENMEIQTQTIFDNMGISRNNCVDVVCRTARTTEEHTIINILEIDQYAANIFQELNAIFFLNSTDEAWYTKLYLLLESDLLFSRKKTSESLVGFLEKLSEFLILLYENNTICLHPIIKFHHLTYAWTSYLEAKNNTINSTYKTLIGLHMMHTRYVQSFLEHIYLFFNEEFKSLSLILNDDYKKDKTYYINKLSGIINIDEEQILAIKPYNSADLVLFFQELYQYAPAIAVVMSTRLKLKIEQINSQLYLSSQEQAVIAKEHNKLFNLEIGKGKTKDILFALKMQAIKPDSFLIDLSLNLNGKHVFIAYNYIMDFIKNTAQKSS